MNAELTRLLGHDFRDRALLEAALTHRSVTRFGAMRYERLEFLGDRVLSLVIADRSEEHTSELQSLMRISYAVFCLKKTTTPFEATIRCNISSRRPTVTPVRIPTMYCEEPTASPPL